MALTYTVVLFLEPTGGYSVHVPAIQGCHTQGENVPESLDMARDAICGMLWCMQEHGEAIPPDVDTFTFEWGDSSEAQVYRIVVEEESFADWGFESVDTEPCPPPGCPTGGQ
jgi:predicted RNase H-like HicB family nuclease